MHVTISMVGVGEVGKRLAWALEKGGAAVRLVSRDRGWEDLEREREGPIVVCVREEALPGVLERLGPGRGPRLVLVQNGFLEPLVDRYPGHGRGLLWFRSKGALFEQLAPSLFHGPTAAELAALLERGGLSVRHVASVEEFRREMIVKGAWNMVVGLPLAVHGVTLGRYLRERKDEGRELVEETLRAAGAEYGVDVSVEEAWGKLRETTRTLAEVTGGTSGLAWRAGAVARMGRAHGVPTPVIDGLLRAVGHDPESPDPGLPAPAST
jgi:ketopantoate reductase